VIPLVASLLFDIFEAKAESATFVDANQLGFDDLSLVKDVLYSFNAFV
jgi:hypothetical protein